MDKFRAKMQEVADSIRGKTGDTEQIEVNDFPGKIDSISGTPGGVYNINLSVNNPEAGEVSGGGVASKDMEVIVSAKLKNEDSQQYYFAGWKENDLDISANKSYNFLVNEDRKLTAWFEENFDLYWETTTETLYKPTVKEDNYCLGAYGNKIFIGLNPSKKNNGYFYSENGIDWVEKDFVFVDGSKNFLSNSSMIIFNEGYFLIFKDYYKFLYRSSDGINWEKIEMNTSFFGNRYCAKGKDIIVWNEGATGYLYSRDGGVNWESYNFTFNGLNLSIVSIATNGKIFVTIIGKRPFYSENGIDWKEGSRLIDCDYVKYVNNKFIGIKNDSTSSSEVGISEDGKTWITKSKTFSNLSFNFGSNKKYIITGANKLVLLEIATNKSAYTEDGTNWKECMLPDTLNRSTMIFGNGKFIIAQSNQLFYSK